MDREARSRRHRIERLGVDAEQLAKSSAVGGQPHGNVLAYVSRADWRSMNRFGPWQAAEKVFSRRRCSVSG
jgi:hypothetical protein